MIHVSAVAVGAAQGPRWLEGMDLLGLGERGQMEDAAGDKSPRLTNCLQTWKDVCAWARWPVGLKVYIFIGGR